MRIYTIVTKKKVVIMHINPNVSSNNPKNDDQLRIKRLVSIDLLRGLVMVLMTLDHTRAFFSNAGFYPLDIEQSNIPLFLTRWITHLCAPSFVFLAGVAAYLSLQRGKSKQELTRFQPLITFGRVPLFFYFIHIWLIRFSAIFLALPKYGLKAITLPYKNLSQMPDDYGYDLHHVYVLCIVMLIILYPICNWFANYKSKHKYWWLNYL